MKNSAKASHQPMTTDLLPQYKEWKQENKSQPVEEKLFLRVSIDVLHEEGCNHFQILRGIMGINQTEW